MTTKKVFVSYDHEGDMLEVLWAFREGYFTSTDDDRILKRLDDDGEVIGFQIHEMSTLTEPCPAEFELESEAPEDDVANITVREAATRLGVSECRVRQLARGRQNPRSYQVRRRVVDSYASRSSPWKTRPRRRRRSHRSGRAIVKPGFLALTLLMEHQLLRGLVVAE